jgi:hypothetical protein
MACGAYSSSESESESPSESLSNSPSVLLASPPHEEPRTVEAATRA